MSASIAMTLPIETHVTSEVFHDACDEYEHCNDVANTHVMSEMLHDDANDENEHCNVDANAHVGSEVVHDASDEYARSE
eukprot:4847226-Amphidinium_carterae.1